MYRETGCGSEHWNKNSRNKATFGSVRRLPQWAKVLADEPDYLSLIPGNHVVGGEDPQKLFPGLNT